MTITLEQVEANGGWLFEVQPRTPWITPSPLPFGAITVDPNEWTVINGVRQYDDAQYRLVRELDARHSYYDTMIEDGYMANAWQVGDSDPPYTDAVSPYGSPSPVADRQPFPGTY
jgi:hypothetical protein